jgi:hypothetical protein
VSARRRRLPSLPCGTGESVPSRSLESLTLQAPSVRRRRPSPELCSDSTVRARRRTAPNPRVRIAFLGNQVHPCSIKHKPPSSPALFRKQTYPQNPKLRRRHWSSTELMIRRCRRCSAAVSFMPGSTSSLR